MEPGLCGACVNARVIENRRGSTFYLCELSKTDARFRKYPVLPVLECPGHEPEPREEGSGPDREPDP